MVLSYLFQLKGVDITSLDEEAIERHVDKLLMSVDFDQNGYLNYSGTEGSGAVEFSECGVSLCRCSCLRIRDGVHGSKDTSYKKSTQTCFRNV